MPRIQFSDVTPPDRKRSIRNVPIPTGGKRKVPFKTIEPEKNVPDPQADIVYSNDSIIDARPNSEQAEQETFQTTQEKKDNAYEYYYPKEKRIPEHNKAPSRSHKKTWVFGGITAIVIVGFIVSMMTVFASATIIITPKSQDVGVDMKITSYNEVQEGAVKYEIVKLAKSDTVSVPATGEEAVELKASGKIVIYNNFSKDPQRLIVRTRFESPEGLIYRIPESVVVPGKTMVDGKETPGSIEVEVFADEAGEKYNIKKVDFTIPGFKNDADRYKNFYARSSTEMDGGFIGKMKTVSETDKQSALQNLETEIEATLKKELASKIPEGLTLIDGAISYKSKELPAKEDNSSVSLNKEVTAYAIMFNTKDLSKKITDKYILEAVDWNNIKAEILDFSQLKIQALPKELENVGKIDLQINGTAKVWAIIDIATINQKLVSVPKKSVSGLMDEFAGISSITSTVRPIWKQSFPDDSFKIHVKVSH
jgi:hypothetical protein